MTVKPTSIRNTEQKHSTGYQPLSLSNDQVVLQYFILSVVTIIAIILRAYKLGEWSFWIEEYHTLTHVASLQSFSSVLLAHRPVFYLLNKPIFVLFGVTEFTARIIAMLAGVLAIPLLYWLAKQVVGWRAAIVAVLLLSISTWHIYWSQNARFYSLLLLFFSAAAFAVYWGVETGRPRYFVASFVSLVFAVGTHAIAALLLPIFLFYFVLLWVLPFERPVGLRWRNLLPFALLPVVSYLVLEIYRVLFQGATPILVDIYQQFFDQATALYIGYANPYIMLTAVIYYISTPVALLALVGMFWMLRRRERAGLFLAVTAFTPLLIIMALTLVASTANRYVFMAQFFWVLLAAVGVQALYLGARQGNLAPVVCLIFLVPLLLRDPVVKDLLYYLPTDLYLWILLVSGAGSLIAGIVLFVRLDMGRRAKVALASWCVVVYIAFVHQLSANEMYYVHQHGHRGNWKQAASGILDNWQTGDVVYAAIPPLATYYLGHHTDDVTSADLDVALTQHQRVWLVDDADLEEMVGDVFVNWTEVHCSQQGKWDTYTAGRNWKFRILLCG